MASAKTDPWKPFTSFKALYDAGIIAADLWWHHGTSEGGREVNYRRNVGIGRNSYRSARKGKKFRNPDLWRKSDGQSYGPIANPPEMPS